MTDVIVYEAPGGRDYVALFDELDWVRWPAEQNGWSKRKPCAASVVDECYELPARNAALALILSGADDA